MNDNLTAKHCVPCEGGTQPLSITEENAYASAVENWHIHREDTHLLEREFQLANFKKVLAFVNKIGELAESEGHHPNLYIHSYKKLKVTLYTHAIGGLSMNDFIMAAKIDELWQEFT